MKGLRHKTLLLAPLLAGLISSGCVTTSETPARKSLLQAYSAGHGEGAEAVSKKTTKELTLKRAYGYTKPYVPVLEYPQVKKIWIPDHLGEDKALISGHWVYVILKPPQWLQVDENEQEIEFPSVIPFKRGN